MILAGGKSRRMGRDKLPLEFGGVPLIGRVYRALEPRCAELLVAGANAEVPLPPAARRIPDRRAGSLGPLAGIEAGLLAAGHPAVFVAEGDMPFLSERLVGGLMGLLAERRAGAVVPRCGGRVYPLCAAYDRDGALPAVSAALDRGALAVRDILESLPDVVYVGEEELWSFGEPARLLANVNSPEELELARAVLDEPPAGKR